MKTRIISLILGLMGLMGIALLIIIMTPMGLPTGLRLVSALSSGEVTYTQAKGRLADQLSFKTLTYTSDDLAVSMEDVVFDWRALRLLTGTVFIKQFSAQKIDIRKFDKKETESEPFNLQSFSINNTWLNLIVEKIDLNEIYIAPTDQRITHLSGTLILNEQGLRLRQFQIKHPQLLLQAQANIGPKFSPPVKVVMTQTWAPDKDTLITGETFITGDLVALKATQSFKGAMDAQLDITADNIGPHFKLKAIGHADIADLRAYQHDLLGSMHIGLALSYDHAHGIGYAKLNSTDSKINGKPFILNFNGTIENYAIKWKDNSAIMGSNSLTTSGDYGAQNAHVTWDIKAPALNEIINNLPASLNFIGRYQKEGDHWSQSSQITFSAFETTLTTQYQVSALHDKALDIVVSALTLGFPDDSVYRLKQPTKIIASDSSIIIDPTACLVGPKNSSICANNIDDTTLDLRASNFPQQIIARYFTPRFIVTGNMNANAQVTFQNMQLNALNLKATFSPTQILRARRKQAPFFELGGGQFNLSLSPETLTTTGIVHFIDKDFFDWNIHVTDWKDDSVAILTSDFNGHIQNLSPLRLFITETNDFAGILDLDLQATGQVLAPNFSGALTLKDARLAIPSQGLILENGLFKISPSGTRNQLDIRGGLKSGEGTLSLEGILKLQDSWPATDLKLTGEGFMLSNTDKALVYASPRLRIQTQEKLINVTGELHIPQAALNLQGYQSYIAPSPDIIIIQDDRSIASVFYDLNTRILLSLGKDISLKASHFDTGIEGELTIVQESNAPTRATGQLSAVNAEYAAYGQKLAIDPAILTFNNSPIDNPTLFIEASREVQIVQSSGSQYMFTDPTPQMQGKTILDGKVGMRVTGTVQNPKYSFFSTPSMSEADQLSYLLTGSPSTQVGAAQAAFMLGALTESTGMLGVSDTDSARLKGITKSLDLDLNIESGKHIDSETGEAVNDTNLVVGKALRPRLYVSYTVGLLDPLSTFRVRYQLSRHWAVQTETNTQGDAGGDILYGIETDSFLGID